MPAALRIRKKKRSCYRKALVSLLLAFSARSARAQQETANELWPELDVFWKLNQNVRLEFDGSSTRDQDQTGFNRKIGTYLNIYVPRFKPILFRGISKLDDARMQRIRLRAGYEYHHSFRQTPVIVEHRSMAEGTWTWLFPYDLLASNRNRFEFRVKNGVFSWRYRNRFKVEKDLNIGNVAVSPFISGEAFYDSAPSAWNRFRFETGLEFPVETYLSIRPYYARQIITYTQVRKVNAVGLTLNVYIK